MPETIKVFVSYCHQDAIYLENDSLLGFLKGLAREGIEFWTDRAIRPGELWDEIIKQQINACDIALVLVSQGFLDSDYCRNVEIKRFLAQKTHLFPVILSPCEWRRHDWLASRQFLPAGDRTIEEDYRNAGACKRLFLEIREQLRACAESIRQAPPDQPIGKPNDCQQLPRGNPPYSGTIKIAFCDRLGDDWKRLGDQLEIEPRDQTRFALGDEGRGIWVWLKNRGRLADLRAVLRAIGRGDLADLLSSEE